MPRNRPFQPPPFQGIQHPPRLPALVGGKDAQRHPVVIVGAGIAGLATALGLGKQGVRTLLLEAQGGVCSGSRAICISRRSLEIIARAVWGIGCDGAHSGVREAMGLKLSGTSYEGRYVIVDVALKSDRRTERLAWFDPPSNPGATILMHRQPDDVWRIDYQLRDDEDPTQAVQPENVIPRVERHLRMIGESDDWAPIWISLYKANALTLESYRKGPLLVAGDAAHLVPIFGVRGANSAFEDADNLAWKLSLVVKGAAPESLLDTYSEERVYAAHENLHQGMKSTEFMSPPSFGFELMRKAVLGLALDHPFVRPLINPRQTQAICYRRSSLNGPSIGAFSAGPPVGAVATDCALTLFVDGHPRFGHLTELLTSSFTVLCFTSDGHEPWVETIAECVQGWAVPLRVLIIVSEPPGRARSALAWDRTGRLFESYGAAPGTIYLLRPDCHVLARWREATGAEVCNAIAHALGLTLTESSDDIP